MASGRSVAASGRRRSSKKGPATPTPRALAQGLRPGTEVEVRIDDEGFYGSWYEATVDGFDPTAGARGRGSPARYTVTYARLVSEYGPERVAVSHVRPRPPPPPPPAPGFLLHDIVEVFTCDGWWSGIVVDPVPDPGAPVTVAFPITREVSAFSPHLVRRRRDYVGGEWVPSMAVVAIHPRRGARVYKAGEKVEVLREREAYGDSWFPAVVAKAVDKLSYIVEYLDGGQEGGGMAKEYLHWGYIRPAQYPRPRESKVHLGPGAAVEVRCDGAWSQGTVCRVVGMGCSYEVSVKGEKSEQLLTKAAEEIRPLYMWNGRHWTIPSDQRQANSRQQSASQKNTSTPVDATSSDDKHCCDPESSSSRAKKSRREPQMQELILEEGLEHASVFVTDRSLSAWHKSLASDPCPNSGLPPSEKNGQLNAPVSVCGRNVDEASDDEHSCAPESSRAKKSRREPQLQELRLEEGSEHASVFETDAGSLSTLHKFLASDRCPNSCFLLSEKNGQLNEPVSACGRNADEACNMLSISEVREQNITSSLRNQQAQERPSFVKALSVKKGVSKNKRGGTHPNAQQGENNPSYTVQVQLKENNKLSSNGSFSSLSTSTECQTAPAQIQQVSGGIIGGSDTECVNFEILARDEGAGLLDKELAATINRICQGNRSVDVGTSTATTQNDDSSPFTNGNIQLRSCTFSGSFMLSHPSLSQVCGDHVPFVKRSPVWGMIDAMDVFKKLPQQPHFSPLMKYSPGLREGMALGLMVTFADSVVGISNSSIADPSESFGDKISTLKCLEDNGFDVQFLRYSLTKLQQVKSNHTIRLTEKEELNAQVSEKATSMSQIVEQLDKKEQTVARLEGELGRARSEAQMMAEEKESKNKELSELEAARSRADEACGDAELQFQRILAEVRRKSLT
ncbi:hypothetical protein BS78_02G103500 [Paspalum vaginatum]|nr:hypothetical protein BS78_02G103500 [Paspalum vaginatum]